MLLVSQTKRNQPVDKVQIIKWRTPRGIIPSQIHETNKYSRKLKHKKKEPIMEKCFEIYFEDLTEDCQKRLEEFYETNADLENWIAFPVSVIWIDEEENG